ncbi:hypothetical protein HGP14_03875 [Rhizobium sp. P32RR-XVIII]|uniref:hypothetical protein n=1 Tax=Rhizobium sp. P32RR-XVIII TaxID=2726738 RepID=UPI00145753DA|nr:hypothetical protein [Rhizobium sp. P32RR-XVIII]NLS02508.1 hypothetical protein [Rhizobium sp. P32RR-XVIII]
MRFFAITTMLFGWLFYSAMSALAGCPMCASMQQPVMAEMHYDMTGMDMSTPAKTGSAKDPCVTGDNAHMAFCTVCLIVPPALMVDTNAKHMFAYPLPGVGQAIADHRIAPQPPPPRLV